MTIHMLLTVHGIVQGVGFRPFILRQARALKLSGSVTNTSRGVVISAEGEENACAELLERIKNSPPPGARIFSIESTTAALTGEKDFVILPSEAGPAQTAVSPDLGICEDCRRELLDPGNRRYRYPFLNCTACGPRFTIIRRVPYDRVNTSMSVFPMCFLCASEYHDPENRRFHAQPTACPACGPRLIWLENGAELDGDPVGRFTDAMAEGRIVAVRGLGGYHLACCAENEAAVRRVRERKRRYAKPLAVMVRDLSEAERLCEISDEEREELCSAPKPIVLLKKRENCPIVPSVAPENDRLGVMLPYTPLHVLLMQTLSSVVMTSANISDAPMPYRDGDAMRVSALADALLTHDRPIIRRMDDSVLSFIAGRRRFIRRARGFAPEPVPLGSAVPHILSFGAQLKNTFCLAKNGSAYMSGHMGDLDDAETFAFYRKEISSFLELFGGKPQTLACDLHPDYASTRAAEAFLNATPGARLIKVQHHHAHFASVLAEHGLEKAQGFIWDGSGLGTDGTLWGGEQFTGGASRFERISRLRPISLIGKDAAVREPWRVGLAVVAESCGDEAALALFGAHPEAATLLKAKEIESLSPKSSGMGRLFDAVAAIAGLYHTAGFEGQAAIALEQAYDDSAEGSYAFDIAEGPDGLLEWDWRNVIRDAVKDIPLGAGVISAKFHRALSHLMLNAALPGLPVALSGGVFQNKRLLEGCFEALERKGFKVYANELVPPNDGGISYGQAAVAAATLNKEDSICVLPFRGSSKQ